MKRTLGFGPAADSATLMPESTLESTRSASAAIVPYYYFALQLCLTESMPAGLSTACIAPKSAGPSLRSAGRGKA